MYYSIVILLGTRAFPYASTKKKPYVISKRINVLVNFENGFGNIDHVWCECIVKGEIVYKKTDG